MVTTKSVQFTGASGATLAGRWTQPSGSVRAHALFAHCFTCSKDLHASRRIAHALAERGVACFAFDFTGLGQSGGDFANESFSSNVDDLLAAADFMASEGASPSLLIGHSLGGAAVLIAAARVESVKAVATLAAPANPEHVKHLFADDEATIRSEGEATVSLAGRPFRIKRAFLDDLETHASAEAIHRLGRALLVMHAPLDNTVSVDNAKAIYEAAKHPKSFISLHGADHLLTRKDDAYYAADMIASWAMRYLPEASDEAVEGVRVLGTTERFRNSIQLGAHRLVADEPKEMGGTDLGANPYELLLASLGACTSMTLRMYADRKKWPLESVDVKLRHRKIHAKDCADCETENGMIDEIEREIALEGPLDDEQRARLMEIADRCPVHRTLHSEVRVRTKAV
ncbi:MAG: alpha/beta fold hydrolase [Myxococcota bacterium]